MSKNKIAQGLNIKYAVMQCLYWMSFVAVYSFAAYFLQIKGFDEKSVGFILAAGNVLAALIQIPLGAYADKSKNDALKKIIFALGTVNALCAAFIVFLSPGPYLYAIFLILMLAFSLTMHAFVNSFAMEYKNAGININFPVARAAGSFGAAAAPLVLGRLVSESNQSVIPASYFVMFVLLALSVFLFKPAHSYDGYIKPVETVKAEREGVLNFLKKYKKYAGLLVGTTLIFTSYNMAINFLIHVATAIGGGAAQMGTAIGIASFFEIPGMLIFMYLSKKRKPDALLKLSAIFFTVKSLGIFLATNVFQLYVAHFAQILSFAIFVPSSVYYINNLMEQNDRIKGQAYMTTTITLGGIFGSLAGGSLISATSVNSMLLISVLVSLVGTAFMLIFTQKEQIIITEEEINAYSPE